MDIQLTDVSLGAVKGVPGDVFHFTIDGAEITVERWATSNASGQDAYRDGRGIKPDEEFGDGALEEIDRLIEAFDTALDLTAVRQAEQFAVEAAIAQLGEHRP